MYKCAHHDFEKKVSYGRFYNPPFPFPYGEAIRRHVARGVAYAALKTTPSNLGWVASSASRLYPSGALRAALTPTPLKISIIINNVVNIYSHFQ